jgi:hypothetical protein
MRYKTTMRFGYFIILMALCLNSCSQNSDNSKKVVIDYQGKELSEDEIKEMFKKEMLHFEIIQKNTEVEDIRLDAVTEYISSISDVSNFRLNLNNLDHYNIDEKLFFPFQEGKLTTMEFLSVMDTLNSKLKRSLLFYLYRDFVPQLAGDDSSIDKILKFDKNENNSKYSFFIKSTQQYSGFDKAIEDSLSHAEFYNKRHPKSGLLLSRYTATGNNEVTLKLLDSAIKYMPFNDKIDNPIGDFPSVFDYLYIYGDENTKKQTKILIYKYLKKARPFARAYLNPLLSNEVSPEFKEVIQAKLNYLDTINDVEKKKKEEKNFQENYLKDYARNFGMESVAYIKPLLVVPNEFLKYKEDSEINYRITDYPTSLVIGYALSAIQELSTIETLSAKDKQFIVDLLVEAKLQNSDSYNWRYYVDILKLLYPKKEYSDFEHVFSTVDQSSRYMGIDEYWNRRMYSSAELDYYLDYLNQVGFEIDSISPYDKYEFSNFGNTSSQVILWRVLDLIGVSVHYDCETGFWPNPYDELILKYLKVCNADLPDFFPIYRYEKLNDNYDTKYTAVLTDGKKGYKVNPKDNGDWYDPSSIEAMLNQALSDLGIKKRFVQIATGDQTVLSIYCEPGQIKLFADKFGLDILHEQNYGER